MRSRSVHIDDLRLRVPGLSATDARRLGERVAQRLAENPGGLSGTIPSVGVRVPSRGAESVEQLAERIVAGIRTRK
jgi:hypothetical protein